MDISSGTLIVGLICAVVGVVLGQFLSRMFSRDDKANDKIEQLEAKVHALELAQVGEYATKADVRELRAEIVQRFDTLTSILRPLFKQFNVNAVLDG